MWRSKIAHVFKCHHNFTYSSTISMSHLYTLMDKSFKKKQALERTNRSIAQESAFLCPIRSIETFDF